MLTYSETTGKLYRPDDEAVDPPVIPSLRDNYDEPKLKGAAVLMFDISFPELQPSQLAGTGKSLTDLPLRDDDGAPISIPIPPAIVFVNNQYIASIRPLSDVRPSNHYKKGRCHLVNPRETTFSSPIHTVVDQVKETPLKPELPKPDTTKTSGAITQQPSQPNPSPVFAIGKLAQSQELPSTPQPLIAGFGLQKKASGTTLPAFTPTAPSKAAPADKPAAGPMTFQSQLEAPRTSEPSKPQPTPAASQTGKTDSSVAAQQPQQPQEQPQQNAKPTITNTMEKIRAEAKNEKLDPLFIKLEFVLNSCQAVFDPKGLTSTPPTGPIAAAAAPGIGSVGVSAIKPAPPASANKVAEAEKPNSAVPKLPKLTLPTNDTAEALLQGVREALDLTKIPFQKHRTLKRIFSLLEEKDKRLQAIKSPACLAQLQAENEAMFARLEATERGVQEAQRRLRTFLTVFKDEVSRVAVDKKPRISNHSGHPQLQGFGSTQVYNSFFGNKPAAPSYLQAPLQQVTFSKPPAGAAQPQKQTERLPPPPVLGNRNTPAAPVIKVPTNLLPVHSRPASQTEALAGLEAFLQQTVQDKSEHYDGLLRELHNLQQFEQKRIRAREAMQRVSQFRNTVRPHSAAVLGGESALPKSRGTVFDLRNLAQEDSEDESVEEILNQNGFTAQTRHKTPGWLVPSSIRGAPESQRKARSVVSRTRTHPTLNESLQFLEALKNARIRLEFCLNLSLRKELEARNASARATQAVAAMTVTPNPSAPGPANPSPPTVEAAGAKGPSSSLFGAAGSKPAEGAALNKQEGMFTVPTAPKAQDDQTGKQGSQATAKKEMTTSNLGGIFTEKPGQQANQTGSSPLFPKIASSTEPKPSGLAESTVINSIPTKPQATDPLAMFSASKPLEPTTTNNKPEEKAPSISSKPNSTSPAQAPTGLANSKPLFPTNPTTTPASTAAQPAGASASGGLFSSSLFGQSDKPADTALTGSKPNPKQGMGLFSQTNADANNAAADNLTSPPRKGAGDTFLGSSDSASDATAKRKQSTMGIADPRLNKPKPTQMAEVPEEEEDDGPPRLNKATSVIGSTDTAGNPTKKVLGGSSNNQSSGNQPLNASGAGLFGTSSSVLGAGVSKSLFDSNANGIDKPAQPTGAVASTGFAPASSGGLFASMGAGPTNPAKPADPKAGASQPSATAGGIFGTTPAPKPTEGGLFSSFGANSGTVGGLFQSPAPAAQSTGLSFTAGATQNIFAADASKTSAQTSAFGQTASFAAIGKAPGAMGSTGFGGGMGSSGFGASGTASGFQVPATLASSTTGSSIFGAAPTGTSWLAGAQTGGAQTGTQSSGIPIGGALSNLRA